MDVHSDFQTSSIFSDGNLGAHGGSDLSGVGGMIRLGELLGTPISHIENRTPTWYFGEYKLANEVTTMVEDHWHMSRYG